MALLLLLVVFSCYLLLLDDTGLFHVGARSCTLVRTLFSECEREKLILLKINSIFEITPIMLTLSHGLVGDRMVLLEVACTLLHILLRLRW